ncbi:hypothetical protein GE09DRAFT_133949 [Coniochaeta sp. 2T2.1]|nr:hypothetical protein GE09DRAFT_133949 [Coniochaeta sp. 2T2.1]
MPHGRPRLRLACPWGAARLESACHMARDVGRCCAYPDPTSNLNLTFSLHPVVRLRNHSTSCHRLARSGNRHVAIDCRLFRHINHRSDRRRPGTVALDVAVPHRQPNSSISATRLPQNRPRAGRGHTLIMELNLPTLILGFTWAIAAFTFTKAAKQTYTCWHRSRRINAFIVMVWLVWATCLIVSLASWMYLEKRIHPR